jgi:hypothetical protein
MQLSSSRLNQSLRTLSNVDLLDERVPRKRQGHVTSPVERQDARKGQG